MVEIRVETGNFRLKVYKDGELVARERYSDPRNIPLLFGDIISEKLTSSFSSRAKGGRFARKRS